MDYGSFEGTIPEGQYGAGTVIVWDQGTWAPVFDAAKGYAKGHLEFELQGEKLTGRWHLIRMRGKPKTQITLTIVRKGEMRPFEVVITRGVQSPNTGEATVPSMTPRLTSVPSTSA